MKHNGEVSHHDWVKIHVMSGVTTHIVTSVEVTSKNTHDVTQFPSLVMTTAKSFTIRGISADKAYSSRKNLTVACEVSATPYIPFRTNATGTGTSSRKGEGVELWQRMFYVL